MPNRKRTKATSAPVSSCVDCDQPDNGSMVQCDDCDSWTHYTCAGVDSSIGDTGAPFHCSNCQAPGAVGGDPSVRNTTIPSEHEWTNTQAFQQYRTSPPEEEQTYEENLRLLKEQSLTQQRQMDGLRETLDRCKAQMLSLSKENAGLRLQASKRATIESSHK